MIRRALLLAFLAVGVAAGDAASQNCTGTAETITVRPGTANGTASVIDFDNRYIVYFQSYQVDLTGTSGSTHTICVRAPSSTFTATPAVPTPKPTADITVQMILPTSGPTVVLSTNNQAVGSSTKKNVVTLEVRVALSWDVDNPARYDNSILVTVFK